MTGQAASAPLSGPATREGRAPFGGIGWFLGNSRDYDREYAVDLAQLA